MIKIMADWTMVPIIIIAAYALLFKVDNKNRFKIYAQIIMAGLTAYMIAKFAAILYQPSDQRPFELLGVSAGASYLNNPGFPSDHALFVTAIVCAVWFSTKQKNLTIILVALLIAMSVGRVFAHVHTSIDIIGGIAFSLVGSLWYINGFDSKNKK